MGDWILYRFFLIIEIFPLFMDLRCLMVQLEESAAAVVFMGGNF